MNMSLVPRLRRKMHLCRSSSNVPCLPSFLEMLQNPHVLLTFEKVQNPLRLSRETTSERPKVVRTWCVLYILTSKCASRHNGVHFFDISTSKSGPKLRCFVHFCTFWLRNVLRATTACAFLTSQLLKVVRSWGALYILTCKCASRHNGVQFFISHLASWLRTRRFSEPTFRPSGAPNQWKNTVFRDFPTFSRICFCFLLTLSLLWSSLFYSLSLLSASSLLCFSSVHIVGSLTSKLPSMIFLWDFYDISMWFLWDFHDISFGFLWYFYGIPMGFQQDVYGVSIGGFLGISMIFLWDFFVLDYCVISMGFPWWFFGISLGFQRGVNGISIGCQSDFYGISMVFLWFFYGISLGVLLGLHDISIGFLWYFYGITIGFLWDSYGIPMGLPCVFNDISMRLF